MLPYNPGTGGGGRSSGGKGGGSSAPASAALLPVTGGLSGTTGLVVLSGIDNNNLSTVLYFDPTNFDCETDCFLQFRVEESEGVQITIKRLRVKYRNLGPCTLQITYCGMFNTSNPQTLVLGNPSFPSGNKQLIKGVADGRIYNAYLDYVFTDENPQIQIYKQSGMGQLSIISITAIGDQHKPDLE